MILSTSEIKENIKDISNKNNKISREIKSNKLIKLKKGLYETDKYTPNYLLAGSIYGPSYISFDFCLAYYDLIPERVVNCTSATFGKKKKKKYVNYFGTFLYRDIPKKAYPFEVEIIVEGNYSYQIATKEKALCDKLYTLKPISNLKELEYILLKDLRIDDMELEKINKDTIEELAKLYHSTNVTLLAKYLRRAYE